MCIAAANYLINRTNNYNRQQTLYKDRISMSCKRLQKLLYFSDVIYMRGNNGDSMFTDDFYAWPSGPVIPSVYDTFVQYQNGEMVPLNEEGHSELNNEMITALDFVFNNTIKTDTADLVEMSHIPGGPWASVYNENDAEHLQIISKTFMYQFYLSRNIFTVA